VHWDSEKLLPETTTIIAAPNYYTTIAATRVGAPRCDLIV